MYSVSLSPTFSRARVSLGRMIPAELPTAIIFVVVAMGAPPANIIICVITRVITKLPPVVSGVGEAVIHHVLEADVLLDEDLAEGAVLAEQDGLKANQFQQGEK